MIEVGDREGWAHLLSHLTEPSALNVADAVADAFDLDAERAYGLVEEALETGTLVEDTDASAWGTVRIAEPPNSGESKAVDPESSGDIPTPDGSETTIQNGDSTEDIRLAGDTPVAAVAGMHYPDGMTERDWWVTWILDGVGRKRPVAPWKNGHAYPAQWHGDLEGDERPETDFETAKRWADFRLADVGLSVPEDAQSDGLDLGIILPNDRPDDLEDRIALIDWDDVRDPDTGEIHPVAAEYINEFGGYVEVSTSGKGLHQFVAGGLRKRGKFIAPIDSEPFIGDDRPQVEIYDGGRHVAMTGRRVEGSGRDVVKDGQAYIDELITEYADAEKDAGHRVYDPESGESHTGTGDSDGSAGEVPEPKTGEYNGPTLDELRSTKPEDRSLDYHAVVETFYRGGGNSGGFAHIQNWRLEGFAAALGERDDLTPEQIKKDLAGRYLDDTEVECGCSHETPHRVDYGHRRAETDRLAPPSWKTLVEYGVLPPELLDAGDADPVAALGVEQLESLDADEQRRAAKKRGHNIPTTREARKRLRDSILREIRNENTTVLDAPTALGKSHTVATEPWLRRQSVTGDAPVIHLHQTREARDEAASETADSMATGEVLLSRKEASPVARGDHDPVPDGVNPEVVVTVDGEPASDWFDRMCDEKGLAFSTALAIARERNDQQHEELPPFGEEDPAVAQWDNVPRTDDGDPAADVIHATHQFAHVPSMRTNTNIVLDEQPDFRADLSQDRIRRMVIAYLKEIGAPTSSFEAFVSLAGNDQTRGDAAAERDALGEMLNPQPEEPETEWYVEEPDAHALAPGIAKAIWKAIGQEDPDRNDRRATKVYHEPPRFDANGTDYAAGTWLSVVVDGDNTIQTVRATPDLRQARAVVGLDAHPSMPMWELNAAPGMTRNSVLEPTERRLWRRYERGLTVVQVGDATRPRSGPKATEWMNDDRVRAVLKRLRDHYGTGFKTALTTQQTERQVRNLLDEVAGGSQIDDDNTMHYGEEKSRNDFADEQAGYVYGCMDPGDEMVLNTLAELGLDATPETAESEDGETHRAKGRGFEGEDDEKAAAVLASVRENHVAQAAGRYARNADGDHEATVYLNTDAAPAGFVDIETPGVEWLATDLQQDIIEELHEPQAWTVKQLADAVECSKEHVRKTLDRLEEKDLVECETEAGAHGADVYRDAGAEPAVVDIETTNDGLSSPNRWSLAISERHGGGLPTVNSHSGGDSGGTTADPPSSASADPPDRPDSGD